MRPLSRRAVFGTAAAVTVPIGASATTRPAHPDAELLALCRTFDELQRQYLATDFDCDTGSPADLAAEAERDRLEKAQDPLVDRIAEIQATTLEGVAARARSLVGWDLELLREDREVGTGAEMARAVFGDLLALGGAT